MVFHRGLSLLTNKSCLRGNALFQQKRGYIPKSYYFPFAARVDDDEYLMPPSSDRPLYRNLFDQADDPKLFEIEKKHAPKHVDVKPTDDIAEYPMSVVDPHRMEWAHISPEAFYYQYFDNTFPRTPDLSKGELAVGAQVTRTSIWHTPNEPAIQSIARFEPSNFQPVGYAENNYTPEQSPPEYYHGIEETPIATRRHCIWCRHNQTYTLLDLPSIYDGGGEWTSKSLQHGLVSIPTSYSCVHQPGMQWPKPVEVKFKHLRPGEQMTVLAGGNQAFIRHRTDSEIRSARSDDARVDDLRDPELDADRCPDPEWLICSASCTHLGCTPHRGGAYGGWLCPCHGSHYDTSGRIRAGPAPKNLPIIRSEPIDEETVLLGELVPTERRWT
ncbi:uncharacterized protein LOC129617172 [Condylostylus longicornis]|uniref:uncharacterized protein LOC129617172 n=1 Tax=Condylostylus longicornis TaxID=2530218 RepID=UPI00244DEE93|nr:uncharacterized protein LOC129617172 [Condylostylus longicornis]